MRMLAIDCSTEACSVALFDGDELVAGDHRILGRGHAEQLVPMIAALPDKGRAERIVCALGPGSFTGIRIGIATARALGIAWRAEVLGYPTFSLIAARSYQREPRPVTVCMNGGHGEWFVQNFADGTHAEDEVRSLPPGDAALACRHQLIVGNRAHELAALLGDTRTALDLMPDARQADLLSPGLFQAEMKPLYGRGPDAKLPQ
ncbi:MAG: tRNA (adenosine(37)-N6)-threonylcarbamoyltransferase complex dimerization subunit type 1 TsaB [Sphingomonadales bacterium]|nr:tRNA (adenosine(37)-N6)-threonylcarbamoyltransferase complex dimerization subunit type 1 TsaB [Sphingomonadales bacterium]MBD3774575.1 tRNA (adenosine(37)-N6)-threonylcarbamoyltransferase complex dimerization subunit type 1 TsaB [Paracoccaceae bacterium]